MTVVSEESRADSPKSVVVIGLGYVGLPLIIGASEAGHRCVGYDVSEQVVNALNSGTSHVDDISSDVLRAAISRGFVATYDERCIGDADVIVICVPTPLDEHQSPDLTAVKNACQSISTHLKPHSLVVLESTTYPGTTDGLVREILELSGLVAGNEFHLAFSPERIDPGNQTFGLRNTPKVVGGYTAECTMIASDFYSSFIDVVVPVSGTREAEMAKLLENTFRHVNIALMNELAVLCHEMKIDIWQVIEAAKTKPFGFTAFYPGPGVGGHCIPIDPNYLAHSVKALGHQFKFVELAQDISNGMPTYVVNRAQAILNDHNLPVNGSRICVLGLTYKANIADDRETPARPIVRRLISMGADIVLHDPFLTTFKVGETILSVSESLDKALEGADLVILLQAHTSYDLDEVAAKSVVVFDTRGIMRQTNVVRL